MLTLDQCYGNILNAYKAVTCPTLGKSDYNIIHLLHTYKAKLKQEKPAVREVTLWSEVCKERLRDCFDDTNWDIFFDNCVSTNELTETITSYIIFCDNNVVPTKTV